MSIKVIDAVLNCIMPELKTDKDKVVSDVVAKMVMIVLASHADDQGRAAYPSIRRLCRETGLCADSVVRALNALRTNGFIELVGRSKWETHNYTILLDRITALRWTEQERSAEQNPGVLPSRTNPSLNRQLNRPPGGLSEKPNAEPGEQIKIWTEVSQDPAIKPSIRVEAIQSLLGARLNVHAATKRWNELAVFVDARQQERGQMLETFLHWLTSKRDFDLRYWSPGRMMELWPKAFPSENAQPPVPQSKSAFELRMEQYNREHG